MYIVEYFDKYTNYEKVVPTGKYWKQILDIFCFLHNTLISYKQFIICKNIFKFAVFFVVDCIKSQYLWSNTLYVHGRAKKLLNVWQKVLDVWNKNFVETCIYTYVFNWLMYVYMSVVVVGIFYYWRKLFVVTSWLRAPVQKKLSHKILNHTAFG